MTTSTLHSLYDQRLRQLGDAEARLAHERAGEAALRGRWTAELAANGAAVPPDWFDSGFQPGAPRDAALDRIRSQVMSRAELLLGRSAPPVHVASWPDDSVNARALRHAGGGLVLVNTGFVTLLRELAAPVAASAGRILENPDLGQDADAGRLCELAVHSIVGGLVGADVRAESVPLLMRGPRDDFRQELLESGMQYLVAHEVGHLLQPDVGGADCVALDVRALFAARTEQQVLGSQRAEVAADRFAYDLLLVDRAVAPLEHLVMVALGAALVLSMQSALYCTAFAIGEGDWGWTHPAPDMRVGMLLNALDDAGLTRPAHRARLLLEWAEEAFGIADARQHLLSAMREESR